MADWAARILSTENVRFVDGIADDVASSARHDTPEDVLASLRKLDNYTNLSSAERLRVRSVLLGIHYLSEASFRNAGTTGLAVADIIHAGKGSFKIPYIQVSYRQWQCARKKAWQTWAEENPGGTLRKYLEENNLLPSGVKDEDLAEHFTSPETYVSVAKREDAVTYQFLRGLLGDSYNPAAARAVRTQKSRSWAFFDRLYRPMAATRDPAATLATIAADGSLSHRVGDSIAHLKSINAERELGLPAAAFSGMVDDQEKIVARLEALLKSYSPDGQLKSLDGAALQRLVGKRGHAAEQVIDELVGGYALLYREVYKIKAAQGLSDKAADELMEKFLQIDGMENFFEMMLRQVEHEHGYIFEQLVTIGFLRKGFTPDMIILQSRIADKCGPDLLVLIRKTVNGKETFVARIVQMKSYKNLNEVIRATETGEALSQCKSDIRRMIRGVVSQDKEGAENIGLAYDSIFSYKIDWSRIQKDSYEARLDTIIEGVTDPTIKSRLKTMAAADPASILSSTDPAVSKAVRDSFKKIYVEKNVADINKALAGYQDEWVDIFMKRDGRPATDAEILDSLEKEFQTSLPQNPGDGRDAFYRIKKMVEDGKPDDVVTGELKKLYRDKFGLADKGAITVEVDIVDAMIDDSIANFTP